MIPFGRQKPVALKKEAPRDSVQPVNPSVAGKSVKIRDGQSSSASAKEVLQPVFQGKTESGHISWDVCDCDECYEDNMFEEEKPKKKKTTQQKLRERYERGDPEVYLLGEPSGKFYYYVLYPREKPSFPTASLIAPKPSWSDIPEPSSRAQRDDDSWKEGIDPLLVEKLILGDYEQDYHGQEARDYAEQHLKKQGVSPKVSQKFDQSQLITRPGAKVRIKLQKEDGLPEVNMIGATGDSGTQPTIENPQQVNWEESIIPFLPIITRNQMLYKLTPSGPNIPTERLEEPTPESDRDRLYRQMDQRRAERKLMRERVCIFNNNGKRKPDPSQLITPPGTKVCLHFDKEEDPPECNMIYPEPIRPYFRNNADMYRITTQMSRLGEERDTRSQNTL